MGVAHIFKRDNGTCDMGPWAMVPCLLFRVPTSLVVLRVFWLLLATFSDWGTNVICMRVHNLDGLDRLHRRCGGRALQRGDEGKGEGWGRVRALSTGISNAR